MKPKQTICQPGRIDTGPGLVDSCSSIVVTSNDILMCLISHGLEQMASDLEVLILPPLALCSYEKPLLSSYFPSANRTTLFPDWRTSGFPSSCSFEVNEHSFAPLILRQHHDQPPLSPFRVRKTVSGFPWRLACVNAHFTCDLSVHSGPAMLALSVFEKAGIWLHQNPLHQYKKKRQPHP